MDSSPSILFSSPAGLRANNAQVLGIFPLVHVIIKRVYILIEAQLVMFNFTVLVFLTSQYYGAEIYT